MGSRRRMGFVGALAAVVVVAAACSSSKTTGGTTPSSNKQFVFGMLLVGPYNDHGWSQANYEGGQYVVQQLGGPSKAKMIWLDKVNSSDRPSFKAEDVVSNMIRQGARLIFATSDDFKDAIMAAAAAHPDVPMIWSSGDSAWAAGKDYHPELKNLGNYYMKMEYMQEVAGCAAALTSQTGKIGVVGPLINDETRRFVNAVYLGARYCWANYRNQDASKLALTVKWIGFWFNIPGQTLDPTGVTTDLFNSGADVVLDHLDTTEALVKTSQLAQSGKHDWAIGYDHRDACSVAATVCLGVPYFNWGPGYLRIAQSVINHTFKPRFIWDPPDWANLNSLTSSAVGFNNGPSLSSANAGTLSQFVKWLGDGSIVLFKGPLNWQDGSVYLPAGQTATDTQIWYSPQLLQGITGASKS